MLNMNAIDAEFWGTGSSSRMRSGLRFRETNWGFAVEAVSNANKARYLAETVFKAAGLAILLTGGWIALPDMGFDVMTPAIRLGLSAGFVTTGFSVFTFASRGFVPELRIDTNNREVTTGTMNSRGIFTARHTIKASQVDSFFLLRAKNQAPAKLCARSRKSGRIAKIVSGTEAELVPVLEKITEAFSPRARTGGRVRTKANGAFIHATFE